MIVEVSNKQHSHKENFLLNSSLILHFSNDKDTFYISVVNSDVFFGPPGFGSVSVSQRYESGSSYHQAKIVIKNLDSYRLRTPL
jgi:hypothetical protein